jgi:hypothetical protein
MVFDDQEAMTPAGKFNAVPIPVAPVVACVIDDNAVLTQRVGVAVADDTLLFEFTVIVPIAFTVPQPPVKGIA